MARSVDGKSGIQQRAQSAMEFLMTYGWSILIVCVVIAVLYSLGIFSPAVGPGSCLPIAGFECTAGTLNTAGALSFTFGYIAQGSGALNLTAVGCSNSTQAPNWSWSLTAINIAPLKPGDTETVYAACNLNGASSIGSHFTGSVWIQYYSGGLGVQEEEIGPIRYTASYVSQPTNTVEQTFAVGGTSPNAWGIAYDPQNGYMYVANWASSKVSVISGNTVIANINDGGLPSDLAYDPSNGDVYVTNHQSGTVSVISGTALLGLPIQVGSEIYGIGYDPADGDMYVSTVTSNVVLISGGAVVDTIQNTQTDGQDGVAYDPLNGYMYIAGGANDIVSVISGTNLVTVIGGLNDPDGVAYDPLNGETYVTNFDNGTVSVISGTAITQTITVGTEPWGVAYDPSNGYMYVVNYDPLSPSISVISGSTVIQTITMPAGSWPTEITYNPNNGQMYVADFGTGAVTIV